MRFFSLVLALAFFSSPYLVTPLRADTLSEQDPVIAVIGGKNIKLSDVEDKDINDARKKLFELLENKVKVIALTELAKDDKSFKENKFPVSDEEIKSFYEKSGVSSRGSFAELKGQISRYLQAQKAQDFLDKKFKEAQKQGKIKVSLVEPAKFLIEVPVGTAYLWGRKNAKVMLLEFSDYQCPFCARVQPTLTSLRKDFGNKIAFGYRHFPLEFHAEADEAAVAAECARDQGKFEALHKILFENQRDQQVSDLKGYAKKIGIKDLGTFNQCLEKDSYRERVQKDIADGAAAGMRGTPSFVIGRVDEKGILKGEMFSGALGEDVFRAKIAEYLN